MVPKVECRRCQTIVEAPEGRLPDGWWYTKLEHELPEPRGKPTCQDCIGNAEAGGLYLVDRRELYQD